MHGQCLPLIRLLSTLPLQDHIHCSTVELLRQTEAAALIFASESRETDEKWVREIQAGGLASSMFKEGEGRCGGEVGGVGLSGMPWVHVGWWGGCGRRVEEGSRGQVAT